MVAGATNQVMMLAGIRSLPAPLTIDPNDRVAFIIASLAFLVGYTGALVIWANGGIKRKRERYVTAISALDVNDVLKTVNEVLEEWDAAHHRETRPKAPPTRRTKTVLSESRDTPSVTSILDGA